MFNPHIWDEPAEIFQPCLIVESLPVNLQFADAKIVKRAQHIFFEGLLQPDLVCYIVIEQTEYIKAVCPLRAGRHSQIKFRSKIFHHFPVHLGSRPVNLVYHDNVESVSFKFCQNFIFRQSLNGRKQQIFFIVLMRWRKYSERFALSKDCFITSLSLLCYLFSVYKKKRSLRFHAAKRKSRRISLSRTGGGYEESPFFSLY